ncbi:hypothetical protein [Caballeronia sordidicola]|uniref:Uncharacterized protein n=1 Tax=Caballeronia sordidicola TaxID=196367 RepID=A0A226X6K6_CABSO|nr:hypothetical protein [Caballeronia sordidicola]OXC78640.1 hypothetical protein BSU04_10950 [Caballeronia sordidicola]
MAQPKSMAPDILGQAMAAIIGAFTVLSSAGLSPVVAFLLPAVVAVILLRR